MNEVLADRAEAGNLMVHAVRPLRLASRTELLVDEVVAMPGASP